MTCHSTLQDTIVSVHSFEAGVWLLVKYSTTINRSVLEAMFVPWLYVCENTAV